MYKLKQNTSIIIISSMLILINLSSCAVIPKAIAKRQYTVEKGGIPPSFGEERTTLVCIIYNKKSYDRYLKKGFDKNYLGPKIYLTRSQLSKKRYADLEKYRYVFDRSSGGNNYTPVNTGGSLSQASFSTHSFLIEDRKEDKVYNRKFTSSFFGKLIKVYAKNLELERTKK